MNITHQMNKQIIPVVFTSIALLIYLLCQLQKFSYAPDDTFIYLQYARNIAKGLGFSFNAGESSYGVTSPLWSIILSFAYFTGADGFWFAKFLDLSFALTAVLYFFKLLNRILPESLESNRNLLIILGIFSFTLNTWFVRWSFTGMETSLAVLLVVGIFLNFLNKKYYSAYLLSGLLFLVRPESFVLTLLLTFSLFYQREKISMILKCILLVLAIILPWLVYAQIAFGTIVPNTAIGKATFSLSFQTILAQLKKIGETLVFSSIIEILFSALMVYIAFTKKLFKEYSLLILWVVGLPTLFIITDSDIISRYLLIITPVLTLLAVSALSRISLNSKTVPLAITLFILFQSQFIFYKYVKPHTDNFSYGVDKCFIEIGSWLNSNTPENSRILVNDVGAIGYYSKRYIVDAAALINRNIELNKKIMSTPVNERESTANLLSFIDADYLVQRDSYSENKLKSVSGKKLEFLFVKEFPGLGISDPSPKYYKVYRILSY